jgi:hypothetical protein
MELVKLNKYGNKAAFFGDILYEEKEKRDREK